MKMKVQTGGLGGCLLASGVMLLVVTIIYLLSLWTDRSLEFWLSRIKGMPVDVPLWMSFLATLLLNGMIVLLNLVSELVRLSL